MTLTVADEDMTGQRLRSLAGEVGPRGTLSTSRVESPGWTTAGGRRIEWGGGVEAETVGSSLVAGLACREEDPVSSGDSRGRSRVCVDAWVGGWASSKRAWGKGKGHWSPGAWWVTVGVSGVRRGGGVTWQSQVPGSRPT